MEFEEVKKMKEREKEKERERKRKREREREREKERRKLNPVKMLFKKDGKQISFDTRKIHSLTFFSSLFLFLSPFLQK